MNPDKAGVQPDARLGARVRLKPVFLVTLTLLGSVCASCDDSESRVLKIEAPKEFVTSILRSETAAHRIQRAVLEALEEVTPSNARGLLAVLSPKFVGRCAAPESATLVREDLIEVRTNLGGGTEYLDGAAFVRRLEEHLAGWSSIERREFEFERFFLDVGGEMATGRAQLYLAGLLENGGRADLRATCELSVELDDETWRVAQLDVLDATHISAQVAPFVDVTDAVGFHFLESGANRLMLQGFFDLHRIFAMGGLSAVDWNEDGFWDVIASVDGSQSILFLNDGEGGFVRRSLPVREPADCPSFLLYLDLDGDGQAELASTRILKYEGERASAGLYTRVGDEWKLIPDAFSFANTVGTRLITVQTIVPFDANGDGLLDLFFCVNMNEHSRGRGHNSVEAHDGADNYLFINQGDLKFVEESDVRGIHGTQYTYVALPHDFDGDGDIDLFEGNDFGPNILWENDGTGHFKAKADSVFAGQSGYTMGVTLADHDDDGRFSMYVVNMSSNPGKRIAQISPGLSDDMRDRIAKIAGGNMLYTEAEGGEWIEQASSLECEEGEWGWGSMFFDVDGDGDDELIATNGYTTHSDPTAPDWDPYFWRQVVADGVSLERGEGTRNINEELNFRGSYAGHQRDCFYLSMKGERERFFDLAWHFGLDQSLDGRCVLPLDFDGDGDQDLVMWTLQGLLAFENRMPTKNFARVRLAATTGPRCALDARVTLTAGGKAQHDILQIVEGFQTQVPTDLHFGLGAATKIESVSIEWPSGRVEEWRDLPVNRLLDFIEGDELARASGLPAWPRSGLSPSELQDLARAHAPSAVLGEGLVLNFIDASAADEVPAAFSELRSAHSAVTFQQRKGGAPAGTTFVYDHHGRLRRAFARSPATEDLVALFQGLANELPFPELSVVTGRRLLDLNKPEEALGYFKAALDGDPELVIAHEGIARAQRMLGKVAAAEAAYEETIRLDPDYDLGHYNLGILRVRTGRPAEAVNDFKQALRIQGEHAETLLALSEAALRANEPLVALDAAQRAARVDTNTVSTHLLLAKLLGRERRFDEAKIAFKHVLSLDPKNNEGLRGLALVERLLAESN